MSKAILSSAFIQLIKKLNNELLKMYPNEVNFKVSLTTIEMCEKTNTKLALINGIGNHLLIYDKYITDKDEAFFINKDLSEYESDNVLIMNKLKEYWCSFTPEEKQHVWEYLSSMLKLYKKIKE